MLGAPELDAGLQAGSDESAVKGQNPLPGPAGHAALDTAQGAGGFVGCQRTYAVLLHFPFKQIKKNKKKKQRTTKIPFNAVLLHYLT